MYQGKKINRSESSESISFYLTLMLLSDGETTLNCCFEHEVFSTLIFDSLSLTMWNAADRD